MHCPSHGGTSSSYICRRLHLENTRYWSISFHSIYSSIYVCTCVCISFSTHTHTHVFIEREMNELMGLSYLLCGYSTFLFRLMLLSCFPQDFHDYMLVNTVHMRKSRPQEQHPPLRSLLLLDCVHCQWVMEWSTKLVLGAAQCVQYILFFYWYKSSNR